jgi:transposase-like protein
VAALTEEESAGGGRARQLPVFFCPYCGDEELTPHGDASEWHCAACLRTFTVRLTGTGVQQR